MKWGIRVHNLRQTAGSTRLGKSTIDLSRIEAKNRLPSPACWTTIHDTDQAIANWKIFERSPIPVYSSLFIQLIFLRSRLRSPNPESP